MPMNHRLVMTNHCQDYHDYITGRIDGLIVNETLLQYVLESTTVDEDSTTPYGKYGLLYFEDAVLYCFLPTYSTHGRKEGIIDQLLSAIVGRNNWDLVYVTDDDTGSDDIDTLSSCLNILSQLYVL
ncbi:hypothetical protein SNEBB_002848 [Seison nebaliae]|nr:hypothetical protein SNEBB_002848 [Seison nebaliae]